MAQCRNVPEAELCLLYEEALRLTVPEITYGKWKEQLFAPQEWNLLLEYIHFGGNIGRVPRLKEQSGYKAAAYELLLEEIQNSVTNIYALVNIVPKAVYYDCMAQTRQPQDKWECKKLFYLCRRAINLLCVCKRMHYLYELLEIQEKLLAVLKGGAYFERKMAETKELKKILSTMSQRYQVPARMENCCYLYWQENNESIGDVIRRRRSLLGLTQAQLCKGICGVKTLQRLEKDKTRAQVETVRGLFERLGLSTEYQRKEIVSDNYRALSYTIALPDMKNLKEGYLTCTEIGCIYNIAAYVEEKEAWQYYAPLWELCSRYEEENDVEAHLSMYLLVMRGVASHLGNAGRYQESDGISDRAIRESLKSGKVYMFYDYMYNQCRNDMECQKQGIPVKTARNVRAELQACITLSRFYRDKSAEAHFCKKMKEWFG